MPSLCQLPSSELATKCFENQGEFLEGETIYTHLPVGYPVLDASGRPKVAQIKKPIYGIQQAGSRLQRKLFGWLKEIGFSCLDDSDSCIFSLECANGEILTIGVYVEKSGQSLHPAARLGSGWRVCRDAASSCPRATILPGLRRRVVVAAHGRHPAPSARHPAATSSSSAVALQPLSK